MYAQKDKCLEGNCKNGQGLKRIVDKAGYHFYEMGNFKSGELTGKGYKLAVVWNASHNYKNIEDTLAAAFNNGLVLNPSLYKYYSFEKGNYENGKLSGQGYSIIYRNSGYDIHTISEGEFKNGLLHGKAIKKLTKEGVYFKYDSVLKKSVNIPAPEILYHGIFEDGLCTDCIKTDVGYGGTEIHMYGKGLDKNFLNGWVIKDYTAQEYSTLYKMVEPYRALYIGGFEIAKLPGTEVSANIVKVDMGNGITYTGEVDDKMKPYGFGKIEYPGWAGATYEGMVDNGQPHGYGYWYAKKNDFETVIGGRYRNGKIIYGAAIRPGVEVLRFGSDYENASDPEYRADLFTPIQGGYTRYYYQFDKSEKKWNLSRQESGFNVNGFEKNKWVAIGLTNEEKRKQRTVTGANISISDLLVGDVIVVDGMASPVVSVIGRIFTLKNGRTVSASSGVNSVKLSKYKNTDFLISCDVCKGTGQVSYSYQRQPEQVSFTRYVPKTIVGDFYIWKTTETVTTTYTKTFPSETRYASCTK
ncbi:MAG: hypothetical protein WAT20_05790, partial [Ferruginibacter sp.]